MRGERIPQQRSARRTKGKEGTLIGITEVLRQGSVKVQRKVENRWSRVSKGSEGLVRSWLVLVWFWFWFEYSRVGVGLLHLQSSITITLLVGVTPQWLLFLKRTAEH